MDPIPVLKKDVAYIAPLVYELFTLIQSLYILFAFKVFSESCQIFTSKFSVVCNQSPPLEHTFSFWGGEFS